MSAFIPIFIYLLSNNFSCFFLSYASTLKKLEITAKSLNSNQMEINKMVYQLKMWLCLVQTNQVQEVILSIKIAKNNNSKIFFCQYFSQ